ELSGAGDISFSYDANGNQTTVTRSVPNIAGRQGARSLSLQHEYDALDRLTAVSTSAKGSDHLFSYNALGSLVQYTDRTRHQVTYLHDAHGNLVGTRSLALVHRDGGPPIFASPNDRLIDLEKAIALGLAAGAAFYKFTRAAFVKFGEGLLTSEQL